MTRQDCMDAYDRLEEAKLDLREATSASEKEDAREEIDHWNRALFRGGYQEPDQ